MCGVDPPGAIDTTLEFLLHVNFQPGEYGVEVLGRHGVEDCTARRHIVWANIAH